MATSTAERGVETPNDSPSPVGDPDAPGDATAAEETEPETFPREYVERLRAEAAEHRTKAKRAEEAERRLRELAVADAVRGILTSPDDLGWEDEYADEDGYPDPTKIRAAAEELIARKPYLARPTGDVGQGRHDEDDASVSLSALLRAGA